MWFTASIVVHFAYLDGRQENYCCWDNIVLIWATDEKEARDKAFDLGRAENGSENQAFTLNDRPATTVFVGVRGIRACPQLREEGQGEVELDRAKYLLPESEFRDLCDGKNAEVVFTEYV